MLNNEPRIYVFILPKNKNIFIIDYEAFQTT